MTPVELGSRIAIPVVLGALIGFERQWHRRLAGLRTNALVATGSAGFVVIGALMTGESSPTRIAARSPLASASSEPASSCGRDCPCAA